MGPMACSCGFFQRIPVAASVKDAAIGVATEVPPMLYTPEFMESEIPSAFEELTFKPGAVTKTPLLPFTSGRGKKKATLTH